MKISLDHIRKVLNYDPMTGIFTWKERSPEMFKNPARAGAWNTRYSGKRAGREDVKSCGIKYRRIMFKSAGVFEYEHRLAWVIMTGEEPPVEIDHINRDATDNRWENIRASCRSENSKNLSKRINNTSGFNGVYWNKAAGKWQAQCGLHGDVKYLGIFERVIDAAKAAQDFRLMNGFENSHGIGIANYHAESGQ